ncbi:ubiquitin-conjugating enzyme E2 J1, partial [Tachysurus ichikawai]
SQDFCCEMCGCSMRTALLALTPNSERQPVDPQAQELAQQISFKAESSTSSAASESKETPSVSQTGQQETSSSSEALDSQVPTPDEQAEPASESAPAPAAPAAPSSRSLSPRQRRAQNRNQNQNQLQRRPTYPAFPVAAQQDGSHTGSAVLIVLLTLALAALVFRRIYLAQDYKFDYEL